MKEIIPYRCPVADLCLQIQEATRRYPSPDPEHAGLAQDITQIREGQLRWRISRCASESLRRNEESCIFNKDGRRVADRINGFYSIPDSLKVFPIEEAGGTEVIQ